MLSPHALDRIHQSGRFSSAETAAVARVADRIAAHWADRDAAVRIATCPYRATGTATDILSRESNGDEVWAIVRQGTVVTVMLRRSTQPVTLDKFRVDTVAHGKRAVLGRV